MIVFRTIILFSLVNNVLYSFLFVYSLRVHVFLFFLMVWMKDVYV